MASNKELRDQIGALHTTLGGIDLGVDPEKLNNSQLAELVADLEAKVAAASAPPAPPAAPAPPAPPATPTPPPDGVRPIDGATGELAKDGPAAAPAATFEYTVAPRCSIMAAGVIVNAGEEIVPAKHVPDPADLANLIAAGTIIKR